MQTAGWAGDVAAGPEALAGGLSPAMMMDDEYMLYTYKVRACDRKGAHSWTECPFTHPGEKAARRCPKSHIYSAEACPDARKSGKCARGDACPYSHGVFEQWLHPSRYRTQLCSFGAACRRPVCFFAHSVSELRLPTACGPPAAAAQPAAAVAAAMAAARNTASLAPGPNSMEALMQQALLAQMAAASPSQVDGATATLINRYQAASCAALANAAACQRQQQQHQAAAAAAAAAAVAAAASNPASLLGMAQAAQAYQAAAAAAAAAAANVPYGGGMGYQQQAAQMQHQMGMPPSTSSAFGCGGSGASSPTCGSGMSRHSSSAYESAAAALFRSGSGGTDNDSVATAADLTAANNYLLQQALFAAAGGNSGGGPPGMPRSSSAAASPLLPWLPSASGGMPAFGYPSSLLPATPAASDTSMGSGGTANGSRCSMSCGLDALAPHLQRQLSLSMFQPASDQVSSPRGLSTTQFAAAHAHAASRPYW